MKKRNIVGMKKSSVKKAENKAKRTLKTISDIREIEKSGFIVPKNSLDVGKFTRNSAEIYMKKELSKPKNKKFLKRIFIKSIQHPDRNVLVYILVVKKRR